MLNKSIIELLIKYAGITITIFTVLIVSLSFWSVQNYNNSVSNAEDKAKLDIEYQVLEQEKEKLKLDRLSEKNKETTLNKKISNLEIVIQELKETNQLLESKMSVRHKIELEIKKFENEYENFTAFNMLDNMEGYRKFQIGRVKFNNILQKIIENNLEKEYSSFLNEYHYRLDGIIGQEK